MNLQERLNRLDAFIAEDRIIRGKWTDGGGGAGQERACLLATLSPETGEQETASVCPASVMPKWLAALTPGMDDNGSLSEWPAFIRRYASLARRWSKLTPEVWHRLDFEVRAIIVREAASHTRNEAMLAACGAVVDLCSRVVLGQEPQPKEWAAARAAAAWAAAPRAAARAAVADAAEAAAWAAAWAAAPRAAAADARAAWDRMNTAVLDAIERACVKIEAGR